MKLTDYWHTFQSKLKERSGKLLDSIDYFIMISLGMLFTIMAFFRLGNTYAPETHYDTHTGKTDIVLDFGEDVDVSYLSFFLGNLNTRHLSISSYNVSTQTWDIIVGDAIVESVFAWNKVDLNCPIRYLGIVCTDEDAVFNELVVINAQGELVTPINTSEYPELFDEQDMFDPVKTYMTGTMFDEIYHGRTAYEFIHGLTTYETTHPPFGKILIAIGVMIFGMNPFGWRFMSVLFGIFIIPVMYIFAKRLFKNTFIAGATTTLLVFDFMHYALSRIATIDIFAAFFILLMYYFLYDYFCKDTQQRTTLGKKYKTIPREVFLPLGLCGLCMGLGIATKWTGIYAGAGLGLLFIWYFFKYIPKQYKKLIGFCCIFFIFIPGLIYLLSYIPVVGYTEFKGPVDKVIQNTKYMFDYHANLVAEHYYASPFYEWPIIKMPLLYVADMVNETDTSCISCMGNPIIWWTGIPCTIYMFYLWFVKADKKAGFLCIAFLAQYVPWIGISRITFIYHFFPASLFMLLMMGYTMQTITARYPKYGKRIVCCFCGIAIFAFILFFPVISGLPVYREWGLHLRWLKNWILVL